MFCDLRDFSGVSERLGASITYRLLSDLMDRLTDCVFAHLGVIVDYFGDGLCAMWNAPIDQPDHADRACQAALDMLRDLPKLDRHWQSVTGGYVQLGIGIHTGSTLVGNAGSRRRMKYGPARACHESGQPRRGADQASRSVACCHRRDAEPSFRALCPAASGPRPRGGHRGEWWSCTNWRPDDEAANWQSTCEAYATALRHFEQGRLAVALAVLDQALGGQHRPQDGPSNALRRAHPEPARRRRPQRSTGCGRSNKNEPPVRQIGAESRNRWRGTKMFEGLSLLKELEEDDVEWILETGKERRVPAQTAITQEGVRPDALYLVSAGPGRGGRRVRRRPPSGGAGTRAN